MDSFRERCDGIGRAIPLVLFSAILAVLIIVLASHAAISIYPHLFDGADITDTHSNRDRNALEIWYFLANISLPIIATVGGVIALRQVSEARRARLAGIYMQIADTWSSERAVKSRMYIHQLRVDFETDAHSDGRKVEVKASSDDVAHYINLKITDLRASDLVAWNEGIYVLVLMENIGMLCRRGNIDPDEVADFMCAQVVRLLDLLKVYVQMIAEDNDPTAYSNAKALYRYCSDFIEKEKKRLGI